MNPNHVLAAAISYLFGGAPGVGRATSPSARRSSRRRSSTASSPTSAGGWSRSRWASSGSSTGWSTARSGSAARRAPAPRSCAATARVWTTDKDGITACLLAAELTATLGRNPAEVYAGLTERFGAPAYRRIDAPATPEQKARARAADGGRRGRDDARRRPDHGDPHDGARATARRSAGSRSRPRTRWFAARPSGTENVTKLYAESFRGEEHLGRVLEEAAAIVAAAAS